MMIIPNTATEEILKTLETQAYFTLAGLSTLINKPPHYCSMLVDRWKARGYLLTIKRGMYVTREYHIRHVGDLDYTSSIAYLIDPASYLSLEFVLQKYNVLTEAIYTVTSVSLKTTRNCKNDLGRFYYKSIKQALFNGFVVKNYNGMTIKEASLEKALFDYMYFRPLYHEGRKIKADIAEELRLNLEVFSKEQVESFNTICKNSKIKKMELVSNNFMEHIWKPL